MKSKTIQTQARRALLDDLRTTLATLQFRAAVGGFGRGKLANVTVAPVHRPSQGQCRLRAIVELLGRSACDIDGIRIGLTVTSDGQTRFAEAATNHRGEADFHGIPAAAECAVELRTQSLEEVLAELRQSGAALNRPLLEPSRPVPVNVVPLATRRINEPLAAHPDEVAGGPASSRSLPAAAHKLELPSGDFIEWKLRNAIDGMAVIQISGTSPGLESVRLAVEIHSPSNQDRLLGEITLYPTRSTKAPGITYRGDLIVPAKSLNDILVGSRGRLIIRPISN